MNFDEFIISVTKFESEVGGFGLLLPNNNPAIIIKKNHHVIDNFPICYEVPIISKMKCKSNLLCLKFFLKLEKNKNSVKELEIMKSEDSNFCCRIIIPLLSLKKTSLPDNFPIRCYIWRMEKIGICF